MSEMTGLKSGPSRSMNFAGSVEASKKSPNSDRSSLLLMNWLRLKKLFVSSCLPLSKYEYADMVLHKNETQLIDSIGYRLQLAEITSQQKKETKNTGFTESKKLNSQSSHRPKRFDDFRRSSGIISIQ